VLTLDIEMPKMSGLEFLSEVRSDDQLKDSVVFMLTTSNAEEDKIAAHKHNVAGYVVKQCAGQDFASLIELLEKYCEVVELPVHQHR
jgi:CheY-like chemotaxis protein